MVTGEVSAMAPSLPSATNGLDIPPNLARVVAAWDRLPDAMTARILAHVLVPGPMDVVLGFHIGGRRIGGPLVTVEQQRLAPAILRTRQIPELEQTRRLIVVRRSIDLASAILRRIGNQQRAD